MFDRQKLLTYASRCTYTGTGFLVTHADRVLTGSTMAETVGKMLMVDVEEEIRGYLSED